jgi:hypothetical protein
MAAAQVLGLLEWAAPRVSVVPDDPEAEGGHMSWDASSQSLQVQYSRGQGRRDWVACLGVLLSVNHMVKQ